MHIITATELARNLRQVLDHLAAGGEDVLVERNQRPIARMIAIPPQQTALEVMADLYCTLPEAAARDWLADARASDAPLYGQVNDPWAT